MPKRRRMTRRSSKKNFRSGTKIHKRNYLRVKRGGVRA